MWKAAAAARPSWVRGRPPPQAARASSAPYNLYEISGSDGHVEIIGRTRGLLDDRKTIGDLGMITL